MFAKARRAHFVFEQWENLPDWTAAMKLGRTTLASGESHLKNNLFDCGTHKRTKIFASVLLVAYAPGVHIVICFLGRYFRRLL
jgi:hypothetical protein